MGLAWRDGKLYVADPPDLVVLEDADGDGRADRRRVILSGFGHTDNGSLHGLTFGPDGWLYMTMGEPDGYRLKRRDGSLLIGGSGALFRCRPDGSDAEVVCRGFENLVEVVFTPRGEIIGTDNFFQRPSGGFRDALVHLVEGGLYPYAPDKGTPQPITCVTMPAVARYPAVALSGLALERGPTFPAAYRGNLFSAQHNARRVMRHVLIPDGSTFRTEDSDFVTSEDPDFHPSDVLQATDGSLLVVDTGSWYVHHCPTGQIRKVHASGGIYRVRPAQAKQLDDAWGVRIPWAKTPVEQLTKLLADLRPVVRDRAHDQLALRGKDAVPALAAVLTGAGSTEVKQRALWALVANASGNSLSPLRSALTSADADLVATAARALGRREDRLAAGDLGRLLGASSAVVRLAAAEALARCGDRTTVPLLWRALAQPQPDPLHEHALIHAVHHLADTGALMDALDNPSPRVQRAALVLLDQPPRPADRLPPERVLKFVAGKDAELRQAALQIVQRHPQWVCQARGQVGIWLTQTSLCPAEQDGLRGLILAFQSDRKLQDVVAGVIANGAQPGARRAWLLETLAETRLSQAPLAWTEAVNAALHDRDSVVREQAVRAAVWLQAPALDDRLAQIVDNSAEAVALRLEALRGILLRRPKLSATAFTLLLGQLDMESSPVARLAAAEVLGRAQLDEAQMLRVLPLLRGDAFLSPSLLLPALPRSLSADGALALLDSFQYALDHGWRPSAAALDRMLHAVPSSLHGKTTALRKVLEPDVARQRARLAQFEPLLSGGDPARGRAVFYGKKVACAACHRVGSDGGQVGPDVTRIGAVRSGNDLLESILFPSSTIAQGYESYLIATRAGRFVTGILAQRSAEGVLLRDSSGAEQRLRMNDIDEMKRLSTSLMPDGLERALSADEFRDLLAFLRSLR
jgi:putative membrane-bound dehydrogenase-like protein